MSITHFNTKSRKYQIETRFFKLLILEGLTLLPYTKITSCIVDRHLVAVESDRHE